MLWRTRWTLPWPALTRTAILTPALARKAKSAGTVQTDLGGEDQITEVLIQPDGKIVAVGETDPDGEDKRRFALARYTFNGQLDAGFGTDGIITTPVHTTANASSYYWSVANGAALHGELCDKIVAVGVASNPHGDSPTNNDFALVRYDANGNLDTTFGDGGIVITDFSPWFDGEVYAPNERADAVVVDENGRIIVVGHISVRFDDHSNSDFVVARYLPNGSLDTSFGDRGVTFVNFLDIGEDKATDVTLDGDGNIVVTGTANGHLVGDPLERQTQFAIARLLVNSETGEVDGTLDPSFGVGGKVLTPILEDAYAESVAMQGDKIVVSGYVDTGLDAPAPRRVFAVARYHGVTDATNRAGDLDTTFGNPTNLAPIAQPDTAVTDRVTPVMIDVVANDSDPNGDIFSAVLITQPVHGTVAPPVGGTFTYTPDGDFIGTDSFQYVATDGSLDSAPVTVAVTIEETKNSPPTANDDSYSTSQNQTLTIEEPGLLENDNDADGDRIIASLVSGTSNGSLNFYHDGTFEYTPDPGFSVQTVSSMRLVMITFTRTP